MNLSNRSVLVTGATSGIGLALSQKLSASGSDLIAVGRSGEKLAALQCKIPGAVPIQCDLTSKCDVLSLARRVEDENHPVSILVNNAAVQYHPRFNDADFSFDSIDHEITTNFTSAAWMTSLLLPTLLRQASGAVIVNISSGLAIYPKTSSAIYSATKAALHSFSQSLRYQLAGTSVRVCEVLFPLVDTEMAAGRGKNKISADIAADEIIDAITNGINEKYVGVAKVLPFISRLSPTLTKKILKNS